MLLLTTSLDFQLFLAIPGGKSELPQRTAPLFPQAIAAEEGSQRQSLGERGSRRDVPAIGLIKPLKFHIHKK